MVRFCLVPVVLSSTGGRLPKYFVARFSPPSVPSFSVITAVQDYGREPSMLVAADLSDADALTLAAQPDVTMFPADLDTLVGATDLSALQADLNALNLPGGMVTANTPYRKVVRGILGIFGVAQCTDGKGIDLLAGVTLGATLLSLAQPVRSALTGCMASAGYDTSGLSDTTTIRQVLIGIANAASPFVLLGVTV